MLTYIELFGAVFFIWCENAVPTPLFLAPHPWLPGASNKKEVFRSCIHWKLG